MAGTRPILPSESGPERRLHQRDASPVSSVMAQRCVGEVQTVFLSGRLDSAGVAAIWDNVVLLADASQAARFVLDLSGVQYLDFAGASLLTELQVIRARRGLGMEIHDLAPEFKPLVSMFAPADFVDRSGQPKAFSLPEEVGRGSVSIWHDIVQLVTFVGEMSAVLVMSLLHPRLVRWREVWLICELSGANAMPIILLIGFIIGLAMAFQSAVPLQRFGADIFVANLLTISLVRELGPFITAILLTARSGASFAAEIGTMQVNEEIDALKTMGIDPVRFLAVPRVLGALIVMPVLTIFFIVFALCGGAVVTMSFGYPLVTYLLRVQSAFKLGDLWGGLFKACLFSLLVAGVGCLRGLNSGQGANAVGAATTSAVVSGLILLTIADGLMAVLFYALRW